MYLIYKLLNPTKLGLALLVLGTNICLGQTPIELTNNMFSSLKTIKTLKYTCESNERINGKLKFESSNFKMNIQPFKLYVYQNLPSKGVECLFVAGKNNEKAKVNPNAMPWVALNLNPENDIMLDNRHHAIFDAGFNYTASLLEMLLNKYGPTSEKYLTNAGIVKVGNVDCYHIIFNNPNYKLSLYTTTENNETVVSIARKLHINFYSIMENNSGYKPAEKIKPGTKLIVPNDYASKMELYIHKEKLYPVYIKVFDTKGLYEEYRFSKVEINPSLKEADFSETNPEYKFK